TPSVTCNAPTCTPVIVAPHTGAAPSTTVSATGTSTTGETGSLLSTHSSASYSPGANPEASKVTVTSLLAPGAVTPALGETDSQSGRAHPCRSCPVTAITRCTCG